jgi:hypothetical protein
MIEIPKQLKEEPFDAFFFLPGETEDTVHLESATYKDSGERVGGSKMGDSYHIILFREAEDGELVDVEQFSAVLIDPLTYLTRMLSINWYGIVARMTTTSEKFIKNTFDKLQES